MTPFEFIAGHPALDFVNTVDWTDAGPVADRVGDYADLVRWGVEASLLPKRVAERLRRRALARPRETRAALAAALRARGVLHQVFAAVATDRRPGLALADLNALLGPALSRLRLSEAPTRAAGARASWDWLDLDQRLDSVLWPVIRAAAELLVSDEAGQVRVCGGQDCGWMYVDRSRNGLRRWCQMRTCGTREKSRRRRVG